MASLKVKNDYRVGIITALPIERAAFTAMLDDRHSAPSDFVQHPQDSNSYTWGSIGLHNIVMASLSTGVYGTTSTANTVLPMIYAFPNIKWGLMVGIGAGVPSHEKDIRLGDVAVSQPVGSSGGVFQYDLGKLIGDNKWKRSDWLARPPDILLKALGNLQAEHEFKGSSKAQQHLQDALNRHPEWAKSFAPPQIETDRLFEASYSHQTSTKSCASCNPAKLVHRALRETSAFRIHYGVIASGNSLVKHTKVREKISRMEDQCICIEMEAAGLMNDFPCLVIRGICDYADTHKNDTWQRYASATAAAFAKELLMFTSEVGSATGHQNSYVAILPSESVSQTDEKALEIRDEALVPGDAILTDHSPLLTPWQRTTMLSAASSVHHQAVAPQKDSEIQRTSTVVGSILPMSFEDAITRSDRLIQYQGASFASFKKPIFADYLNVQHKYCGKVTAESNSKKQDESSEVNRTPRMQATTKNINPLLKLRIERRETDNLSTATSCSASLSSGTISIRSSDGGVPLKETSCIGGDQDGSTKEAYRVGASSTANNWPPSSKYYSTQEYY